MPISDEVSLAVAIQQTITELREFFPAAQFGEPAESTKLEGVLERFPKAPPQLEALWLVCDGIDLHLEDGVAGILYSVSQLAKTLSWWLDGTPSIHSYLLPIADDGCGDFACIHCGDSPLGGCVLFVEQHWTPSYLLAGSFSSYLKFWADKCKAEYSHSGKKDSRFVPPGLSEWPWIGEPVLQHPWPYDEAWLRSSDADAARILGDDSLRSFFENQDNCQ